MKNLIFPLSLMLIILGCWAGASVHAEKTGQFLIESISYISDCSADAYWKSAEDKIDTFTDDWDKISKVYALYTHEQVLHDIEKSLSRCRVYIDARDPLSVESETAEIISSINSIMNSDRFTLAGML